MPKRAVITTKGESCFIVSALDNNDVFVPTISEPLFDKASEDIVRILDFSELKKTGEYYLFADGLSKVFCISDEPYRELTNALVKGLYYQRCGCALKEEHAGQFSHGECHLNKATLIHDAKTVIDVSGGWHDAGDYGRYVGPGAVTVGHMLYAYTMFPKAFGDELNIPESGNGIADILNECRYELEWILKMQDNRGGFYHKVATRHFAPLFMMPENDKEELLLFNVSHTATATAAAALALAYRIYQPIDDEFAKKMLDSALKAWGWLEEHPDFEPFENPPNVNSGEYGDASGDDEIFWAACELLAATNEPRFLDKVLELVDEVDISKLGWQEVAGFGALCCLFGSATMPIGIKKIDNGGYDSPLELKLHERLIAVANDCLALCAKSGYCTALEEDGYIWGSILPIMSNAMILICAHILTGEESYKNAAQAQLDYLLGINATGYSFVTGFGQNAFRNPHHRPSYSDGVDDPVPGLVSGGPNKQSPDLDCKRVVPQNIPSAKFYVDYVWTASANEIAIYWNSPAIFVSAFFSACVAGK